MTKARDNANTSASASANTSASANANANANANAKGTIPPARLPQLTLPPELRPHPAGAGLEAQGDYDAESFTDCELTGAEAPDARFMECGLYRVGLDEARLRGARFLDCVLEEPHGVGTELVDVQLRDVELRDARLGGVQLHGAAWERVLVRGGKLDYVNLRGATLRDVTFEGCVLVEPDLGGARLERVAFRDCVLRDADLTGATLVDVDLREAAEVGIARGVDRLSGAVISPSQLLDLAPAFAAELGIRVV